MKIVTQDMEIFYSVYSPYIMTKCQDIAMKFMTTNLILTFLTKVYVMLCFKAITIKLYELPCSSVNGALLSPSCGWIILDPDCRQQINGDPIQFNIWPHWVTNLAHGYKWGQCEVKKVTWCYKWVSCRSRSEGCWDLCPGHDSQSPLCLIQSYLSLSPSLAHFHHFTLSLWNYDK